MRKITKLEVVYVLGRVSYHIPEVAEFLGNLNANGIDFAEMFAEKWNLSEDEGKLQKTQESYLKRTN